MKYDKEFKLAAVQQVLKQGGGIRPIAYSLGVGHKDLWLWIKLYERHGIDGLTHKRGHYTAEFKHQVMQRMQRENWSYFQTAVEFNIRCPRHIGKWLACYHDGGFDALKPTSRGRPPVMVKKTSQQQAIKDDQRSREELIDELEDLRAENAYLKKLDELLQKEEQEKGRRR